MYRRHSQVVGVLFATRDKECSSADYIGFVWESNKEENDTNESEPELSPPPHSKWAKLKHNLVFIWIHCFSLCQLILLAIWRIGLDYYYYYIPLKLQRYWSNRFWEPEHFKIHSTIRFPIHHFYFLVCVVFLWLKKKKIVLNNVCLSSVGCLLFSVIGFSWTDWADFYNIM